MRLLPLVLFLGTGAAIAQAPPDPQAGIIAAAYADPTTRYDHGILGDAVEWGTLVLTVSSCPTCATSQRDGTVRIILPPTRVFEDTAPRLVDLDQDGKPEVIVVETDLANGASLAIYGPGGKIAATPYLGQSHRWLAPIGAVDLDGDGQIEIAYIDRPHLTRELVILRYVNRALGEIARFPGFTNHRIGDTEISGGIRTCDQPPELILLTPDWSRLQAANFTGTHLTRRDLGPNTPLTRRAALICS